MLFSSFYLFCFFRAPASASNPGRPRRVRAAYDCDADNQDELTFVENEVIVVTGVEDQEWWVSISKPKFSSKIVLFPSAVFCFVLLAFFFYFYNRLISNLLTFDLHISYDIVVLIIYCRLYQVGHIEHQPHRQGVFPVSFVEVLPD